MRSVIVYAALLVVLCVVPSVAQEAQEGAGAATEAGGQAEQQQSETISPDQYAGVWTLPQGPLRLEWNLEADQYEFYVYEGASVRIGSRGAIEVDGRELTFTAEEITQDGESWQAVEVEDESRATRTFHATVQDQSLLLASPESTQFYIQYYRPDAVPGGAAEDEKDGEADGGANNGSGANNGTGENPDG